MAAGKKCIESGRGLIARNLDALVLTSLSSSARRLNFIIPARWHNRVFRDPH